MFIGSTCHVISMCFLVGFLAIFASYIHHYAIEEAQERLVVGVLSARNHQAERDAIRATWWPQLQAAGARGVFVVGDNDCQLADHCRLDPYSCEAWKPEDNVGSGERSLRLDAGPAQLPAAVGITFTVLRPVVARAVAVTSHQAAGDVLLETADGQEVAAAASSGWPDSVPVTPYLLPAGFMGRLRLRQPTAAAAPLRCRHSLVPPAAELLITALITADGRHVQPGLEPLCSPLVLVYTAHERSEGDDRQSVAPPDCERHDTAAVQQAVTDEAAQHGDLLLVPGPDTYRRLPDKLLSFYSWAAKESSAKWVVKCDDDVVLDVPRILQNVPSDTGAGIWWGQFRYNWPTDRYGKWAELVYQADVYPPFACGTASLLSMDVARWLAANAPALARFQGEDVSLGVWLAGHRVRRVPDADWWCGGGGGGGYSRGQLTPQQLRQTWRCLLHAGRLELCGDQ